MRRKFWLLPLIAIVLWFALKDVTYRSIIAGYELPKSPAATYLETDGWAVLPVEAPPGAWTEPWGIDLFVIPSPSGRIAGKGLIGSAHQPSVEELTRQSHLIEGVLAPAGPTYAPLYRHPSAVTQANKDTWGVSREDIAMAFERYLYSKNKWRGVLIIAAPKTDHLLGPLLQRIETDPQLSERFSGVVFLGDKDASQFEDIICSPAMNGDCIVDAQINLKRSYFGWLIPNLRRRTVRFNFVDEQGLGETLAQRNTKLSLWLDKNAPKPAEPLGGIEDMEVIEIAPIRRPGETDEVIAERELRAD